MGRVEPAAIQSARRCALEQSGDVIGWPHRALVAPEFLAEARRRGLEVNPVSGAAIDKLVGEFYETPPDIIAEVRAAISEDAR
jgi:hypothetical protein